MRFLCFEVRLYGLVRESDKFFLVPLLVNGTRKSFIDWDAIKEHHDLAMNPRHPHVQGTSQGPDIFFQCVEAGVEGLGGKPAARILALVGFAGFWNVGAGVFRVGFCSSPAILPLRFECDPLVAAWSLLW